MKPSDRYPAFVMYTPCSFDVRPKCAKPSPFVSPARCKGSIAVPISMRAPSIGAELDASETVNVSA